MQELIDELNKLCNTTSTLSAHLARECASDKPDLKVVKEVAGMISRFADKAAYTATKIQSFKSETRTASIR
jgi:hypothetical protein